MIWLESNVPVYVHISGIYSSHCWLIEHFPIDLIMGIVFWLDNL